MNKELETKLEDLFRWKGTVEITDNEGNVIETLYQRIISDADAQKVRLIGLKESKLLRKKLRDRESDEYIAMMPIHGDITIEEMLIMISIGKYRDFRQQAALKIFEERVKEPHSEATLEEQEEYIENVEKAKREYDEKMAEEVGRLSEIYANSIKEKGYDEVFSMHEKSNVDYLCQLRMLQVFDDMSAYLGTYKDNKYSKRRFTSFEEFLDIAPAVKQKIVDSYKNLLMGFDELKK